MTRWQPAERANAIGLALAVGADKASAQTGIPRRTISSWLARERPAPELDALIVQSREDVVAKLWEAVTVGTEQVLAGLRDPKARLGDKANALRIVTEQYQLLTNQPTGINANLNANANVVTNALSPQEMDTLTDWLQQFNLMNDEEMLAVAPQVLAQLREGRGPDVG